MSALAAPIAQAPARSWWAHSRIRAKLRHLRHLVWWHCAPVLREESEAWILWDDHSLEVSSSHRRLVLAWWRLTWRDLVLAMIGGLHGGGVRGAGGSGGGFTVSLSNQTVNKLSVNPQDAYAGYQLNKSGAAQKDTGTSGLSYSGQLGSTWLDPLDDAEADNHECEATLNSGSLDSGTTGSALALTASRAWEAWVTVVSSQSADFDVEIRPNGGGSAEASNNVTLYVEVTS